MLEATNTTGSPWNRPLWLEYVLAVGAIVLALVVRWLLDPVLGDAAPFVTVFTVMLILVLLVRPGPFLAATVVAWGGSLVLFVRPRITVATMGSTDIWETTLFGLAGAAACVTAWLSHRVEHQRRFAHEQLIRRGEELRLVTDAVPALISYVDHELRYRFANARYHEWFGSRPEEIMGKELREVLGDAAYEHIEPHVRAALAGRRCRFEATLPYREGGTRHVMAEYVPDIRRDGTVAGIYALVNDVTGHERAEVAQAQLAAIVESSGDAITSLSLDGEILTWNAGAERLFGYPASEAVGQSIDLILPPELPVAERRRLERVREGEVVGPYDTVRCTKDGRRIDVSVTMAPLRDGSGQVIGVSKIDRDIAARKRAERALKETRTRERSYLEHLPIGIWFANEDGEILFGNAAGQRIWGGVRLVGPEDYAVYEAYWHGTDRRLASEDWATFRAARHGETSMNEELDIVGFDGARRTILNSAVPVRTDDDTIVGVVVLNQDITEQKQAQRALQEADRHKEEFLATLAHELRNPLAAISTATDLLVDEGRHEPAPLERVMAIVRRQVSLMVRLIDDLLDINRISHGRLELRTQRVSVMSLVEQAVDSARTWIERKGHAVAVLQPPEPVEVIGDAVRLIQVFGNVLSNACKYTDPRGHIELLVGRDGSDVVVTIRDDGVGVPPEKLEAIFEMYARVEGADRGEGGLGIGLTLSRRLVEMHGGTMTAASEGPGQGTTITIRLPACEVQADEPASATSGATPAAAPAGGCRILVVDDNIDAADTLALLLARRGHDTRIAYDGTSALREAAAFRPEVILLDLGLPDMDGTDVCQAIRGDAWGRDIVVVALTGWGQEQDKHRTAAAGFDAHLTKPADLGELSRLLVRGATKSS
ncbi:hybrid sensor histidine kinase/response regulator [Paraliomyxa miuraensis]|uniref:hybrid sensor histidine kinase/response regulator n=1 Tax=Paraliomyxa miuraensis TaxID=376150 RepID=UPI00224E0FA9|nr:PAS domain S-box protein [Paraliomyxa miuraensis]MCX4240300.1 PAS domain S-box protein [Paraliomyxa miuraensis]